MQTVSYTDLRHVARYWRFRDCVIQGGATRRGSTAGCPVGHAVLALTLSHLPAVSQRACLPESHPTGMAGMHGVELDALRVADEWYATRSRLVRETDGRLLTHDAEGGAQATVRTSRY